MVIHMYYHLVGYQERLKGKVNYQDIPTLDPVGNPVVEQIALTMKMAWFIVSILLCSLCI